MNKVCQFASIRKVESNDDGTITVIGIASDGSVDADGEVITAQAMQAAIPDYMSLGTGALREMHQLSAAGTVDEAYVNDAGETVITARVVDPIAVLKVQQGVYKGFSVGGSSTSKLGKTITGLRLTEISLVDKPNNPNAVIQMWKCEDFNKAGDDPEINPEIAMTQEAQQAVVKAENSAATTDQQPVIKTQESTDIKKGMYAVSDFACFLREISWMVEDAQWEAESEGDNSPVPEQLKTWLSLGVEIFREMAAEETSEMIASLQKAHHEGDIKKSQQSPAVQLQGVAEPIQKAESPQPVATVDQPVQAATTVEPVQKADFGGDIAKALNPIMDVVKAIQAQNADLVKAQQDLNDRINALPTPPKGVTVSKGIDGGNLGLGQGSDAVEPVRKADGTIDEAATIMKAHFATAQPVNLRS